jgi:hypothetical protein
MKKAFDNYRYLAGSTTAKGSLWEGDDHLLIIESGGVLLDFKENYRRIDYKNIQTAGYVTTSARTWWLVVSLILLGPAGLWLYWGLVDSGAGFLVLSVILGLPMLAILVTQLVRGPTVSFKVQTAVQVLKIKAVRRKKQANLILQRLGVLCRNHQQGLAAKTEGDLPASVLVGQSAAAPPPLKLTGIREPYAGSKLVTYGLLSTLASGLLLAGEAFVDSTFYAVLDITTLLTGGMLTLAGLTRNMRYEMAGSLKTSLWISIISAAAIGILFYGMLMFGHFNAIVTNPESARNPFASGTLDLNSLHQMAKLGFADSAVLGWTMVGLGVLSTLAALLGLPAALTPARLNAAAGAAKAPPLPTPPPLNPPPPPSLP